MKKELFKSFVLFVLFVFILPISAQTNLDTVKAQKFDTGKMWTFEDYPHDYIKSAYGFNASEDWLKKVRLSALIFGGGCTASFVSEDGLIMTNHHCVDGVLESVQKENENIPKNGFFAPTLADERKVPNLTVRQLVLIEDVTAPVLEAMNSGNTDAEKIEKRAAKIKELETNYSKDSGLNCRVISLYNGGKFSLYGYKIYNDIRLVYSNERVVGLYGGDPDNFTYPRYDADFAFLRAYDETGKPMKTENFFKFSLNGAENNELLFVVGNPGSTQRLKTVAQLEYYRDVVYRNGNFMLNRLFKIYDELIEEEPAKADEYRGQQFFIGNSAKVYKGTLEALLDPVFMARKRDFEKKLKNAVMAKPELKEQYSHLWDGIVQTRSEAKKFAFENAAFNISPRTSPSYLTTARKIFTLAEELKKPETDRKTDYKADKLDATINGLFPAQVNKSLDYKLTKLMADYMIMNIGKDHPLVKKMFNGLSGDAAADFALKNSSLTTKEKVVELAKKDPDAILNSNDPFIYYVVYTQDKAKEFAAKSKEITTTEQALESQLGQVLFAVYGTSIPPDATFTLRISDGVMKGYDYNGTIAPTITTFYGLYDRYYSHKKQYPWDLPARWVKPAPEFNYSTPYNFISTNDIIGGNSGSAIINTKAEVVGAVFDGNIESFSGNFIYTTEANRTVSVASQGILEILMNVTNAKRIAEELKLGKLP
ncbi:MAG: S46 family peptidase [Melioribacter sp.]|nr:S46 family peptidase [Melioribacter sp.]